MLLCPPPRSLISPSSPFPFPTQLKDPCQVICQRNHKTGLHPGSQGIHLGLGVYAPGRSVRGRLVQRTESTSSPFPLLLSDAHQPQKMSPTERYGVHGLDLLRSRIQPTVCYLLDSQLCNHVLMCTAIQHIVSRTPGSRPEPKHTVS